MKTIVCLFVVATMIVQLLARPDAATTPAAAPTTAATGAAASAASGAGAAAKPGLNPEGVEKKAGTAAEKEISDIGKAVEDGVGMFGGFFSF